MMEDLDRVMMQAIEDERIMDFYFPDRFIAKRFERNHPRSVHKVLCQDGHTFDAEPGSEIEERCIQHLKEGKLDALCVECFDCPICVSSREFEDLIYEERLGPLPIDTAYEDSESEEDLPFERFDDIGREERRIMARQQNFGIDPGFMFELVREMDEEDEERRIKEIEESLGEDLGIGSMFELVRSMPPV